MNARILIVDDNAFMRMMLGRILKDEGFEIVDEACSGKAAIAMYEEFNPDLVTMDITMPDMSGIDTVREIIGLDRNARIIMVSAMNQTAMVVEALEAGAKDFVAKPFNKERIIRAISRLLNRDG